MPTIDYVLRFAKVSRATVSRVVNGTRGAGSYTHLALPTIA
ncbi:LacI family DNA-binding transcriptional regulator, partial [Klebsiella pneumoniae]